jgi:uncharacterized membrane protein YagU involved in acid resistance
MNKFYRLLLNYSENKLITHFDVSILLCIVFWIVTSKVKISTDIIYLVFTLLIWSGLGFVVLVLMIQNLNDDSQQKSKQVLSLVFGSLVLLLCCIGPVILYLLTKGII